MFAIETGIMEEELWREILNHTWTCEMYLSFNGEAECRHDLQDPFWMMTDYSEALYVCPNYLPMIPYKKSGRRSRKTEGRHDGLHVVNN